MRYCIVCGELIKGEVEKTSYGPKHTFCSLKGHDNFRDLPIKRKVITKPRTK
jgi:hypothetical protein